MRNPFKTSPACEIIPVLPSGVEITRSMRVGKTGLGQAVQLYSRRLCSSLSGYKTIFNGLLATNVRKLDTLRSYIPTSPMFGWGNPESRVAGDMHYWGFGGAKNHSVTIIRWSAGSCRNTASSPFPIWQASSISRGPKTWNLAHGNEGTPETSDGYELIDEYMKREYKIPKDFASYCYVSQILQAEGIKTAIETHMRPYQVVWEHCSGNIMTAGLWFHGRQGIISGVTRRFTITFLKNSMMSCCLPSLKMEASCIPGQPAVTIVAGIPCPAQRFWRERDLWHNLWCSK